MARLSVAIRSLVEMGSHSNNRLLKLFYYCEKDFSIDVSTCILELTTGLIKKQVGFLMLTK